VAGEAFEGRREKHTKVTGSRFSYAGYVGSGVWTFGTVRAGALHQGTAFSRAADAPKGIGL
jgi:hypothetical protein